MKTTVLVMSLLVSASSFAGSLENVATLLLNQNQVFDGVTESGGKCSIRVEASRGRSSVAFFSEGVGYEHHFSFMVPLNFKLSEGETEIRVSGLNVAQNQVRMMINYKVDANALPFYTPAYSDVSLQGVSEDGKSMKSLSVVTRMRGSQDNEKATCLNLRAR